MECLKAVFNAVTNKNYCTSIMWKMCAWKKNRNENLYMHAYIYLCIWLQMPSVNGDQSTCTCLHLPEWNMFLTFLHFMTLKLFSCEKWK